MVRRGRVGARNAQNALVPAAVAGPSAQPAEDSLAGEPEEYSAPDEPPSAPELAARTGLFMTHGLQMARRTAALVAGVRPALPAAMLTHLGAAVDNVVALPNASLPPRDGATRVGGFAAMDAQNRVSIAKAANALGWGDATALVVVCGLGRLTVTQGSPQRRQEVVANYTGGRLTLSPVARGCLRITCGDQVVVCTAPGGGAMVLMAGADVLQMLTGPAAVDGALQALVTAG